MTLFLNSAALRNRVTQLGLKQWWLAEQIGVDRKTVVRWLQGKVRAIQQENAEALANVLTCAVSDFCTQDESVHLATAEDQRQAATLLRTSSLIEKLGPIGEWDVIESLLKATIVQDLPLAVLGDLYNQLTVACWRQSKFDSAELYNAKALQIAKQCGDRRIEAEALLSAANLLSWRRKPEDSIATYKQCLALRAYISEKTLGSIFSNVGAVLYENGDLQAGLEYQERALDQFLIHGKPTNLSITCCHMALIYLKLEDWSAANEACAKSLRFAEQDDYRRGIAMCGLIHAELLARRGQFEPAKAEAREALAKFAQLGINEELNFEFAERVFRLAGDTAQADLYARQKNAAKLNS